MLLPLVVFAQVAVARTPVRPVLSFPEKGLDDVAAYQAYATRFFRDARGNTVQVYVDGGTGRVVTLLADADDESAALSVRRSDGAVVPLHWGTQSAVSAAGRRRTFEFTLTADAPRVTLGWFLLGSMRVERDFQYAGAHRAPFRSPRFSVAEIDRMLAALDRVPAPDRQAALAAFNAPSVAALRARTRPTMSASRKGSVSTVAIVEPSLDATDTLEIDIVSSTRAVLAASHGDTLTLRARTGRHVSFTVRVTTTGDALTPLTRAELFTPDFLRFLAQARTDTSTLKSRWLEREVRGVELLSSREKLMAGLPAYATYFGRDMMVSALMMRPIWRSDVSAFVVASVLRKLGPAGDVSHEEALGGQAVRESAAEYAALVDRAAQLRDAGDRAGADSALTRARDVLRAHGRVRENYHMIDDEFQLPVLASRWLADSAVSPDAKRAFLLDSSDGGGTRAARLLRELALVSRMTAAYVADPVATHLVSFPQRDSTHWQSASWRDSGEGYAGGRFAMDVNAVWVPHALEGMTKILATLRSLHIDVDSVLSRDALAAASPVAMYARDSASLANAVAVWRGAWRHFLVQLDPASVREHVANRLNALAVGDRVYWIASLDSTNAWQDSLAFLALSLDAAGQPIGVANSDPATRLFLGESEIAPPVAGTERDAVLRDVRLFVRPYPVGLLVPGVGPVVANDAYASPSIWPEFERDTYHGPRVVWGREVNLFLLGVASHIQQATEQRENSAYLGELRRALDRVLDAVDASGFHSELWSYTIREGRIEPMRYNTGSDVQLWSTTDLAVQYALWRLGQE